MENLSAVQDGVTLFENLNFRVGREDKIAIVSENEMAVTALFKILTGEEEPASGSFKWGISTSQSYFPKDNNEFFDGCDLNLIEWLRQYSTDDHESYLRGFLGRDASSRAMSRSSR